MTEYNLNVYANTLPMATTIVLSKKRILFTYLTPIFRQILITNDILMLNLHTYIRTSIHIY